MSQRIKEQKEEHHGGSKWIGTGGITAFGHSGYAPKGIRIRGQRGGEHALKVAEERHFRDFRDDHVLGIRQFQVALRRLRRLSNREETPATELDVEETVAATTKKGRSTGNYHEKAPQEPDQNCCFSWTAEAPWMLM